MDDGYEMIRVNVLPDEPSYAMHKKNVSDAVGASNVAVNVYSALPGESISLGYHRHAEQEEIFYVIEGTIAFETEQGGFWIETGEAFFVPTNAPHRCRAAGDEMARVIAIGSPRASEDLVFSEWCPECSHDTDRDREYLTEDVETIVLRCTECGAETDRVRAGMEIEGEPCPECGETVQQAEETVDDAGQTIFVLSCANCGIETDRIQSDE